MSKRKLVTGILTGAAIGGLVTLFDKETRKYTVNKLNTVKSGSSYWIQNPSEAVHKLRMTLDKVSENFPDGAANVINALETAEKQLEKVAGNKETKELEQ
ncbi:YtxH domain-containing protein [Virgibacillus ainsalahensis]